MARYPQDQNNALGIRLRDLREQRGLSQWKAAAKMGVTYKSLTRHESGGSYPSPQSLLTYARYYNVTMEYLMEGGQADPPPISPEPGMDVTIVTGGSLAKRDEYHTKSQQLLNQIDPDGDMRLIVYRYPDRDSAKENGGK